MSIQVSCSYSFSTADNACDKQCVKDFFKKNCQWSCLRYGKQALLYCPGNDICFINITTIKKSIRLGKTQSLCEDIPAPNTAINDDCGKRKWMKMTIWMDKKRASCNMSSTVSFATCLCTYCYLCRTEFVIGLFCRCRGIEYSSPDISSSEITSLKTTSSDLNRTATENTQTFPPTTLAAQSSYNSGITEGAVGGSVSLLLLILLVLFALWFRKKRKSKRKNSDNQPTVVNQTYNAHGGSLPLSPEENHTVPHEYDYVDSAMAADVQQHNTTAEIIQSNDYDFAKPFQPDPEENSFTLNPSEVARHQETIIEESSEMHNMYENDSRVLLHHGYSNTMPEESDYNTLNQEGLCKTIDLDDDQYQHVKIIQNSNDDDYDELANLSEKQKNYPAEDDYDHCKVPSRRQDDNEGDYDHLN